MDSINPRSTTFKLNIPFYSSLQDVQKQACYILTKQQLDYLIGDKHEHLIWKQSRMILGGMKHRKWHKCYFKVKRWISWTCFGKNRFTCKFSGLFHAMILQKCDWSVAVMVLEHLLWCPRTRPTGRYQIVFIRCPSPQILLPSGREICTVCQTVPLRISLSMAFGSDLKFSWTTFNFSFFFFH